MCMRSHPLSSGVLFDYTRFGPEDFRLEDIVIGLLGTNCYHGQIGDYSLGQHAALVTLIASTHPPGTLAAYTVQKFSLLHHGAQAYFSVPPPGLESISGTRHLREAAQKMIYEKFCGREPSDYERLLLERDEEIAEKIERGLFFPTNAEKHHMDFTPRGAGPYCILTPPTKDDYRRLVRDHLYTPGFLSNERYPKSSFFGYARTQT